MEEQIIRGPLLNPRPDGHVEFHPEGALQADRTGRIVFAGAWSALAVRLGGQAFPTRQSRGVITPPFLDAHTHIPQHPIRGRFTEGVPDDAPEGRLLAGLQRNVFPREALASDPAYTDQVVAAFARDTLSQGVIGGAAYMTVHARATAGALRALSPFWSVGLVLMDRHCPEDLRTDETHLERDTRALAEEFGRRFILTDRFAVAVGTPLRRRAADLARRLGLRMQTHLNEQRREKALVEQVLYPDYGGYADVYRRDGLLDRSPILAHCIQMTDAEWAMVADTDSAIAHCPTSNTLLGSGTMPLDIVHERRIPYALCTDVGASPTTSLLAEMAQFLKVHRGRARAATPTEALWRATLGPAQILGVDDQIGSFDVGKPLSFLEIGADLSTLAGKSADRVIAEDLLLMGDTPALRTEFDQLAATGMDHGAALERLTADAHATARRLEHKVLRVTVAGRTLWRRDDEDASRPV